MPPEADRQTCCTYFSSINNYFHRMMGRPDGADLGPNIPGVAFLAWAWIGSFTSIVLVWLLIEEAQNVSNFVDFGLATSFGASAVLLYGVPQAPFAQPWNVIAGSTLSALIGIFCREYLFKFHRAIQGALAVSFSITAMLLTGSTHPPAGAVALNAIIGPENVVSAGWSYAFFPIFVITSIQVCLAVLINNLSTNKARSYPVYWIFWRNWTMKGPSWYLRWPPNQAPESSRLPLPIESAHANFEQEVNSS